MLESAVGFLLIAIAIINLIIIFGKKYNKFEAFRKFLERDIFKGNKKCSAKRPLD
jgi:hypothetical protein